MVSFGITHVYRHKDEIVSDELQGLDKHCLSSHLPVQFCVWRYQ